MSKLYVILNRGPVVGNCALFWREGGCGYTCNLDEAWKVDAAKAQDICHDRPDEDFVISLDFAVENSERHCAADVLRDHARERQGGGA
jgi:hypothetical protein